tara:strand:- start:175 stop:765 length:591 start_codon:yes stop_codon:yes gene_type:complete
MFPNKKVLLDFYCKCCDYKCSKKQNYLKHLSTQKHKNIEMIANGVEIIEKPTVFTCGCGKRYKHTSTLCAHKRTCDYKQPVCVEIQKTTHTPGDLVAILMEQNKLLVEQINNNYKQQSDQSNLLELSTNTIKEMAELFMAADTKNKLLKDKIVEIDDEMTYNNKTQSTQYNNLFEKYIELQETNKSLEDMLSKAHN